ncbi:MAG TPA: dihydrolipoamide acetyltransferase family protein [Candidatus Acidoferrales bacterium]|nr:dihydrolipoamide acetyltransferase family protein [Candidatus Acidoferrales bacterium]
MPDVRDFLMPDLGEGLTEGEIIEWLVAEGDTVAVDQPIADMSTEKAMVQVPTPFAGRVVKLHGAPGDFIKVGSPLISIDVATATADGGSGNVLVGYGTGEPETAVARRRRVLPSGAIAPSPGAAAPPASPLVRRLAAELGIDVSSVTGTGPGGIVTRADIERADAERQTPHDGAPAAALDAGTRHRLLGIDRVAADRLTRSHREIPTAIAWLSADATTLLELRAELDASTDDAHVTPFALVLRVCVVALRRFPRLNAHFDTDANEIVNFDAIHLGVAVQTERGLVVPVIRDAHQMPVLGLAAELARLAAAARDGRLAQSELSGSTFTVSNFGAFGVDGGTAIINPPEAAILGVGQIVDRPWVVGGEVVPRKVVELSLVFDHRVADGAVAGGFVRHVADLIEDPRIVMNDD